ncbi:hypothetical protein FB567DRAFT_184700 [Paraphoma chrysanthemicola]|uniref:Mg2+ transporter protein, CorA-like/Zinc transport protein ZntB n=1 Tax=Paraphoma chrysanthemicola TaxID=798071 RepID=A0A8K0QWR9_9PLEO|nr:hypothetical protein FB567DRAFT_184700 [Paraphoma chrysanthemicola]
MAIPGLKSHSESTIEVLRKCHSENEWDRRSFSSELIRNHPEPYRVLIGDSHLSLIVAEADQIRESEEWRDIFTREFKIPKTWWSPACRRSNGYFGHENTQSADGSLDGCNTWLRAQVKQTHEASPKGQKDYTWYKFNIFVRWIAATKQTVLLIFDPKRAVKERLLRADLYNVDAIARNDPYWIYGILLEELVDLQNTAVWGIRNLVRQTELVRSTSGAPQPEFLHLHDIARHAIHVSETLDVTVTTIETIATCHDTYIRSSFVTDDQTRNAHSTLRSRLQFYNHMIRSLRYRAASNKERLNNEIQYVFNAVTQYNSRISVEIGRAAQSDSAAMKTIAFLTLTFLPATYVCAVFSMSFFNYNPDSETWKVSKEFWLYWVVAIPITIATALTWSFWNKYSPQTLIGDTTRMVEAD